MKKILFYNWIPFDEKEEKGGGVTIYTRNLINHFVRIPEWNVFFLSSGRAYDLFNRIPRIQKTKNELGDLCQSYEIVNSPVFSSAKIAFSFPDAILKDNKLLDLLVNFFSEQGGFDVVHFQNIEGLSSKVFKLKEFFPAAKFVYSLHNYYLFCPQVMLWRNDKENCLLTGCGKECFECMPKDVYAFKVRLNQYVDRHVSGESDSLKDKLLLLLQKNTTNIASIYSKRRSFSDSQIEKYGERFKELEIERIENVNKYIDKVIAVSHRVAEIAINKGVLEEKTVVNYIGTEVANNQAVQQRVIYDGSVLNICYLGYMRTMKGFFFLLEALENMPSEISCKVGVVIASPNTYTETHKRIIDLKTKFVSVSFYDGYSHEDLDKILADVHLGIVPPLWEDNLPQVAIEMKAKGVAVLASDLGGAKELSSAEEFVFKAGDREDFYSKIKSLIENPSLFDKYWDGQMRLVTMEEHLRQLEGIYSGA